MATTFDHKEKLIEDIMKTMEKRETEDLKNIYSENDVNKYSDEAFTAIEKLLEERGELIPFRDTDKKRAVHHAKTWKICGLSWRGILISLTIWSPVILFFIFSFGIEPFINAEPKEQGIAAGVFLITAIIAEQLICLIKS